MGTIPKGKLILIGAWVAAGAAGAAFAWNVSRRPANARATALVLEPRTGSYGPVRLSLVNFPMSATVHRATRDTGVVFVNADGPESQSMLVGVPGLTAHLAGEGKPRKLPPGSLPPGVPQMPMSEEPLTEAVLTRRLVGYGATVDADVGAEMAELRSLIAGADGDGLSTRVENFRLVEATPWRQHWWLRRVRWSYWVVLWVLIAAALWRLPTNTERPTPVDAL